MKPLKFELLILVLIILLISLGVGSYSVTRAARLQGAIQAPVLKWQQGGCEGTCEVGGYSSPVVADLDGDNLMEIIASGSAIRVLDAASGNILWRVRSGHDRSENYDLTSNVGRTWASIVLADVDGDGLDNIVTAHSSGYISVYDNQGYFLPGWPQHPSTYDFRSLSVADLDANGDMEIVVGLARAHQTNTWVYEHTGNIRPGWPQRNTSTEGLTAGIFNDDVALGDINDDGLLEVIAPSDTSAVAAYDLNAVPMPVHSMYQDHNMFSWGEVRTYVDQQYEELGMGPCQPGVNLSIFSNGPANVADVNGDGVNEVVAVGYVKDCDSNDIYNGLFIFNADRSRFNQDGFDWRTPPANTGAPLVIDQDVISSPQPNLVTVDLDGDGNLEILYPSYDGRMHAFWLDKTEHGSWPYSVYNPGEGFYRMATEPVIADLDNDGFAEVIFGSWVEKGTFATGKLHILNYLGNPIYEIDLPPAYSSSIDWNGVQAAPTLANLDGDPDLEIVLNTAYSGVVVYDLPGTASARVLWATGRGSYLRIGSPSQTQGNLQNSILSITPFLPAAGETVRFTLTLENSGPLLSTVNITDTLPADITYQGDLWAPSGSYDDSGGVLTWTGEVLPNAPVAITFSGVINPAITTPQRISNVAFLNDGLGNILQRQAAVVVEGFGLFLPVVKR